MDNSSIESSCNRRSAGSRQGRAAVASSTHDATVSKRAARDVKRMAGMTRIGSGRLPVLMPDERTLHALLNLAKLHCTYAEFAAYFDVSIVTLRFFLSTHKKARDAVDMGRALGCIELRRAQHRLAETSATMAIWLGKQRLGQRDVLEARQVNEDGPARLASSAELEARLTQLAERLVCSSGAVIG